MERILAKAIGGDLPAAEAARMTQEEKRALLVRLLSNFAHEIRNPLSSLDVHVQLLEEDLAGSDADLHQRNAQRFQIIHAEIRRLENVVTTFLQLASPAALEKKSLALNNVVGHACDLLRPQAQDRGLELAAQLADDLPAIEADSVKLTQALINLVINAIQATPSGGHVRVRTFAGTGEIGIEISDDGPGIPVADQPRIFEPYFTTKANGSGLGLWITQQIVLAHGGTLRLDSDGQHGTTFTITLPLPSHG